MNDMMVVENFLNNGRYDLVCNWCNNTTKENMEMMLFLDRVPDLNLDKSELTILAKKY